MLLHEDLYRHKLLVAYIILEKDLPEVEKEYKAKLHGILQDLLPVHMIPSRYQFLDKFPLNISGKIDKSKLLLPEEGITINLDQFAPDDYESIIISIWSAYLQRKEVTPADNFFSLGGDSWLMVQTYSHFPVSIKKVIKLQDLYLFPIAKDLAAEIQTRYLTQELTEQERVTKSIAELFNDAVLKASFETTSMHPESVLIDPNHIFLTGATGFVGQVY